MGSHLLIGKCNICDYDTGNLGDITAIRDKINTDGGSMIILYDNQENQNGWSVRCPTCRAHNSIAIDQPVA